MPPSRTNTSAADLALLAADVPCILAHHGFRDAESLSIAKWDDTPPAGNDETALGAPVRRAVDGWAHHGLHTYPESGDSSWSLMLQVGSTAEVFDADTACLFTSNTTAATTLLGLVLYSTDGYAGGYQLTNGLTPADAVRFAQLALTDSGAGSGNVVYGNVYGAELRIQAPTSPTAPHMPRVRELWLGKRIQLPFPPNQPYSHRREASGVEELVAHGGARTGAVRARGRAERHLEFDLSIASHRATIRRLWDESRGGTESLLWIETPSSDPTPYLMRLADTTYDPVLLAGDAPRLVSFDLVEQAPLVATDP